MNKLSTELIWNILLELSVEDTLSICKTSIRFSEFCDSPYFWDQKAIRKGIDIFHLDINSREALTFVERIEGETGINGVMFANLLDEVKDVVNNINNKIGPRSYYELKADNYKEAFKIVEDLFKQRIYIEPKRKLTAKEREYQPEFIGSQRYIYFFENAIEMNKQILLSFLVWAFPYYGFYSKLKEDLVKRLYVRLIETQQKEGNIDILRQIFRSFGRSKETYVKFFNEIVEFGEDSSRKRETYYLLLISMVEEAIANELEVEEILIETLRNLNLFGTKYLLLLKAFLTYGSIESSVLLDFIPIDILRDFYMSVKDNPLSMEEKENLQILSDKLIESLR